MQQQSHLLAPHSAFSCRARRTVCSARHDAYRAAFFFGTALLSACSSGSSDEPDGGNARGVAELVGGFEIDLHHADQALSTPAYTSLIGRIYDKQPPSAIVMKLDRKQGDCELHVPAQPFCEVPCTPGVCTADDVCTSPATSRDIGTVRVKGLGGSELTISPDQMSRIYQPSASEVLDNPPCTEGAEVRIDADAVSLQTRCIAPLVLGGPDPLPVRTGQPVHVTWTAPRDPALSRVHLKLDIAHHGGKKGEIVCDVPDTGSFDIPEPLVTYLIGLGVAGFPTIVVNREARAAASAAPNVKIAIMSSIERAVDTGVKSCTSDMDCGGASGSCQEDLTCKR